MTLLSQGAEAKLTLAAGVVYKTRTPKSYRLAAVDDALRLSRTNRERKVLLKAKTLGIRVPLLLPCDDKYTLAMEYVAGGRLKDWLFIEENQTSTLAKTYLRTAGTWVAQLHDANILHGDLTTSNLLVSTQQELVLIDFGLSFFSTKIEDRAVDLHVFEQAIESTHYKTKELYFSFFLEGYMQSKTASVVLKRLDVVRARGRNKH
jgi:TP53 regulating kinase-like protein